MQPDRTTGPQMRGSFLVVFSRRFLSLSVFILVLLSVLPEASFLPLNRFLALSVGNFLGLTMLAVKVHGTIILIDGFSVNIIGECTAIHLIALFAAFVSAFPASRHQKWVGLVVGSAILFSINMVRIAMVTLVGRFFPGSFHVAHTYVGQLGVLLSTIYICLAWCRWIGYSVLPVLPFGFLQRFVLFTTPVFLICMPLNGLFIETIDVVLQLGISMITGNAVSRWDHGLSYQTFSMIVFFGLVMAVRGATWKMRLQWMGVGFFLVTLFHFIFRLANTWMMLNPIEEAFPVLQWVYLMCAYALPFLFCIHLLFNSRLFQLRLRQS